MSDTPTPPAPKKKGVFGKPDNSIVRKGPRKGQPAGPNPELTETLCSALRSCAPVKTACALAGVDVSSVNGWRQRALQPDAPQAFLDFAYEYELAIASAQLGLVAVILSHARGKDPRTKEKPAGVWVAAAWMLERRWPAEFGKFETRVNDHTVSPGPGAADAEGLKNLSVDELRTLKEIQAKARSAVQKRLDGG